MKKIGTLLLGLITATAIVACGGTSETATAPTTSASASQGETQAQDSAGAEVRSSKDTMVVGNNSDLIGLSPFTSNSNYSLNVLSQVYETLVQYNVETGQYEGMLAESWEYEDENTIVFHLRHGVKFHNGEEMKASDVVYSMGIWKETSVMKTFTNHIDMDKTVAVDDYTVKLVTTEPYIPQLYMLEYPSCVIVPQSVMEACNNEFSEETSIGTGPYRLEAWITGDRVELTAFEDYWDAGKPYVKNLIVRTISDDTMRTIELETGAIDLSLIVDINDMKRLQEEGKYTVYNRPGMNTRYILFNCASELFKDARLRQAVAYAINIPDAVETSWGSTEYAAQGFFTPSIAGFKPVSYEQNLEKAKELMAEAGYPDGFTCKMITLTTKTDCAAAEVFQAQLAKVGIDMKLVSEESVMVQQDLFARNYDMCIYGYTTNTGEPDRALRRWHNKAGEFEALGWDNQEYSDMVDRASRSVNEADRFSIYADCQQMLHDECVAIPWLHKPIVCASDPSLEGFTIMPTLENHRLKNCWFK